MIFSIEYKEHYKKILQIAYPICISNLGHILVGVVDTAMVGQIGTIEQAAVSLATGVYSIIMVLGFGVSYGITPLVASASKDAHTTVASLLKNGIVVNFLSSLVLFGIMCLILPLFPFFKQKEEVIKIAIPFMTVMALSTIPLSMFSVFKQFTEGLSHTKMAMVVSILGNVLNVILNYILIFGCPFMEPMGVMGSCWATFISRTVMALSMFLYVRYEKQFIVYWKEFKQQNISMQISKQILKIGIPSGLQWFFEIGAFSCAIIMAGWIGPNEQAAHQIAISMAACTYMIANGISSAASVRVGNFVGLGDRKGVRASGFSGLILVFAFMLFTAIVFITFNKILPLSFNKDMAVVSIASSLLIIAGLFQLGDGTQAVALGILRGIKDVNVPTFITVFAYWFIGLPISYVLAFNLNLGIQGIWYGLTFALFLVAILLIWRFNIASKKVSF